MPPRVEPIGTLDAATAAERGTMGLVSRALSSAAVPRMRSPAVREVIRRSEVLGAVQKNHQVQVRQLEEEEEEHKQQERGEGGLWS